MELCLISYIRDARLLTNIPCQYFLAQDFLAQEVLAHLQNSVSIESRIELWVGLVLVVGATLSVGIDNVHHGLILVIVILQLVHLKYHNYI